MLRLYTCTNRFKTEEVLYGNDAVFDAFVSDKVFDALDCEFMMKYDGAKIIGDHKVHGRIVTTRYGNTLLTNISTGLKTLLNLRHMKDLPQYRIIDITEAGSNMLLDIFKEAMKINIPVILRHSSLPEFSNLPVLVDDSKLITTNLSLAAEIRVRREMWMKAYTKTR